MSGIRAKETRSGSATAFVLTVMFSVLLSLFTEETKRDTRDWHPSLQSLGTEKKIGERFNASRNREASRKDQNTSMQYVPVPHLWNDNEREGKRSNSSGHSPLYFISQQVVRIYSKIWNIILRILS